MSEKPVATPRGSTTDNEIKDLECQPIVLAHTEPKGQIGEVSNLEWQVHYVRGENGDALTPVQLSAMMTLLIKSGVTFKQDIVPHSYDPALEIVRWRAGPR